MKNDRIFWSLLGIVAAATLWYALRAERFCMAPFREAQTAISVRYMVEGEGNMATYVTPVLGVPWRVPMECGVFHAVVASLGHVENEDVLGRVVSVIFYLGCAWLVWWIARELRAPNEIALWMGAIFLFAPVHLAFGAAYLIEAFALFFALLHLAAGMAWLRTRANTHLVVSLLAGVVAALSKSTTWATAGFTLGSLAAWEALRHWPTSREKALRVLLPIGAVLAVALVVGLLWVRYSDEVKLQSPATATLASARMKAWNYGTWAQKLSPTLWAGMLAKEGVLLFGPLLVLLAPLLWALRRTAQSVAMPVLIMVGAFLVSMLVFTNLHYRHQYYGFANGVYAVLAAGLLLGVLPAGRLRRLLWYGLPVSCLVTSALFVWHHRALRFAVEDRIVHVLGQMPPNSPFVVAGLDWSPYIPYYARQRAWFVTLRSDSPEFERALELNRGVGYRAVIWQGVEADPMGQRLCREFLPERGKPHEIWPGVWLAVPKELSGLGAQMEARTDPALNALTRVRTLVPSEKAGALQYVEFKPANLWRANESVFRVVLRRGLDVLFFDSAEGILWRFSKS